MEQLSIVEKILQLLSEGKTQNQVSKQLKLLGYRSSSLRSIEDRLRELRKFFNCSTTYQLMYKYGKGLINTDNL